VEEAKEREHEARTIPSRWCGGACYTGATSTHPFSLVCGACFTGATGCNEGVHSRKGRVMTSEGEEEELLIDAAPDL